MINVYNNEIGKVYLGNTRIGKVYVGNNLVYTAVNSYPITVNLTGCTADSSNPTMALDDRNTTLKFYFDETQYSIDDVSVAVSGADQVSFVIN